MINGIETVVYYLYSSKQKSLSINHILHINYSTGQFQHNVCISTSTETERFSQSNRIKETHKSSIVGHHTSKPGKSKVLLPELELHIPGGRRLRRITDISRRRIGSTEVHTDLGGGMALQSTHVRLLQQSDSHSREQPLKIRPAEVRLTFQFGQRVQSLSNGVEVDIRRSIIVQPLREVCVNPQELRATLVRGSAR